MFINDFFKISESVTSPFHYLLNGRLAHYLYGKIIEKILSDVNEEKLLGWYKPSRLMNSREFRGMINSIIQPGEYYYSAMDVAVAINIATFHFSENSLNKNSHEIIDMSYHITTEIKEAIMKNKIIRDNLKEYGKDIGLIDTESERTEIEHLFIDKKTLFKHYFSTFNDLRYEHTIRIWHQSNSNTWIDWSEENSIDIKINPYKIREGFFLIGFDYRDITKNERLSYASNKNGYEFFNKHLDGKSYVWLS
jgi:hypothetical protein